MANAVIMPRQGQSVESCIITEWKKNVGDTVKKGDILFSYETDKSSFDEASEVEGTLLKVFADVGDEVPCLETVCIIGAKGEDISALVPASAEAKEEKPAAAEEKKPEEAKTAVETQTPEKTGEITSGERLKISPRARALAAKTNADLSFVTPTGPDGRIIERDVQAVLDAGHTVSALVSEKQLAGQISKPEEAEVKPVEAPAAKPAATAPAAPFIFFT